jgi:hypothetical protein
MLASQLLVGELQQVKESIVFGKDHEAAVIDYRRACVDVVLPR